MSLSPVVLSVHAVDTLGEEGMIRDAVACDELGCRGVGVVTTVLAEGPSGIDVREPLPLALVERQLRSVTAVHRPSAARTGLLHGAEQVRLIGELLRELAVPFLVVAPTTRVLGTALYDREVAEASRTWLFPIARVVVARASDLPLFGVETAEDVEGMKRAAAAIRAQGAAAALVTGVLSRGRVLDLLDDGAVTAYDAPRVLAPRIGGIAGAHAAAIAARLAQGFPLDRAVDAAQRYVAELLRRGKGNRS